MIIYHTHNTLKLGRYVYVLIEGCCGCNQGCMYAILTNWYDTAIHLCICVHIHIDRPYLRVLWV